ncbi:MAG: PAS domain-containing protein [Acidobacteriota bacterium]
MRETGDRADELASRVFLGWHHMATVDRLDEAQLDDLPFGAIQLDAEGRVVRYNATEASISGRTKAEVIGRDFFHEVAPCTNVQQFAGRFREGVRAEMLNEVFPYRFDFRMQPTEVWIRLYYSHDSRTAWVFVTRRELDDSGEEQAV